MYRGFKYRCYPTKAQQQQLAKTFGACRYVYNWALALRTEAWYERKERVNYAQSSALLTQLKKHPTTNWLADVSCTPSQQALRCLQSAFTNFWEKRSGYPSFKRKQGKQTATWTRCIVRDDCFVIPRIGSLRVAWSREHRPSAACSVVLMKTPSGRYYVGFQLDESIAKLTVLKKTIGLDLGLTSFVTTSDGSKYKAPKPLRIHAARLRTAQKALARKKKGSKNRNKQRIRVAKIHEHIADICNDFLHKLSTKLIRENQTICMEDLNVRGMMKNHKLAGAISDVSWGEFRRQLEYKALWYGRQLVAIDRFYPSSKRCSSCGHTLTSLSLSVRQWTCAKCGVTHDRDINAAINIKAAGLAVLACGDGIRPIHTQVC